MATHHHRGRPLASEVLYCQAMCCCLASFCGVCDWPFHVDSLLSSSFVLWGQISETFEQESCGMFLGESAVGADLSGAGGLGWETGGQGRGVDMPRH